MLKLPYLARISSKEATRTKPGFFLEPLVSFDDMLDVVVGEKALGAFAGDFVDGVDEEDAAFARLGLGQALRSQIVILNAGGPRPRWGLKTRSFVEQADYVLHAAWQILPQFVNPESNHAPAETLELKVSPMVIVLTATAGSSVDRFAVHL